MEANFSPLMPPFDRYVARIDSNADIEERFFVALIEKLPPNQEDGSKFVLKVNMMSGQTIYERYLTSMIDSWHLSKNKLVYQQSLGVKTLTYVRFLKQQA